MAGIQGLQIGTHLHPLSLLIPASKEAYFVCAACRVQDNQQRYHCTSCNEYTIHVACAVQVKRAEKDRKDRHHNVKVQLGTAVAAGVISAVVREGTSKVIHHASGAGAHSTAAAGCSSTAAPSDAVAGGGSSTSGDAAPLVGVAGGGSSAPGGVDPSEAVAGGSSLAGEAAVSEGVAGVAGAADGAGGISEWGSTALEWLINMI